MKKILLSALTLLAVVACSKFDDSEIWSELKEHEERIVKLETLCNQMNTNIISLQTIIIALQNNDYVTNIAPIKEGNKEIGYTITFAKSGSITIYHGKDGENGKDGQNGKDGIDGKDGKDGYTPKISVKQHTDGKYYWTLDGTWLLDDNGNMIPATGEDGKDGKDGKDGITPLLKIEDGYWYLSYDNGYTWQYLCKAVGEDGDSFFENVSYDDTTVTLTLKDGTTIDIPKHIEPSLDIIFESTDDIFCEPGSSITIEFKIEGGEISQIYTIGENGWTGEVEINNKEDYGKVTVYAPETSSSGKIVIFATDSYGHLIIKALTFTDKLLEIPSLTFNVSKSGGYIEVGVSTNLEYIIEIASDAASWVSHVSTRAVRNDKISFYVSENKNTLGRTAEIKIKASNNTIEKTIVIYQEGDRYYSTGSGTEYDPYIINSTGQWENLSIMVANGNTFANTYFKLGANLEFNNATISPIGTETAPFSGVFNANGFIVSNAKISGTQHLGLFGYIKNATLLNFNIESITVSGSKYLGILSGYSVNSTIQNAFVTGSIKSGNYVGGMAGYASGSTIDGCENDASLGNTNSQYLGGIVGYLSSSNVSNSINSGSLTGYDCMGGIVGKLDSSSTAKNCYNDAQFTQGYLFGSIGGVVGYLDGTICACAMNNSINGTSEGGWCSVGGIVGYDNPNAICRYCYYLKHSVINKNFSHVGDLTWGSWYNYGSYNAYGETSSGYSVTSKLNEWVSSNNTSENYPYKKWSGTIPRFEE